MIQIEMWNPDTPSTAVDHRWKLTPANCCEASQPAVYAPTA